MASGDELFVEPTQHALLPTEPFQGRVFDAKSHYAVWTSLCICLSLVSYLRLSSAGIINVSHHAQLAGLVSSEASPWYIGCHLLLVCLMWLPLYMCVWSLSNFFFIRTLVLLGPYPNDCILTSLLRTYPPIQCQSKVAEDRTPT